MANPTVQVESLKQVLAAHSAPAADALALAEPDGAVRCVACGHRCLVKPGREGVCRVRFNDGGQLRVPQGYVAALACDPIEKKPFFHVLPGAEVLTFGMLGCDYHCGYCQNWLTSQSVRDPKAMAGVREVSAERIVELAIEHGAGAVASSYNEPLITAEWAVEIFRLAGKAGLRRLFVSNGNATPEVLDYLRPHLDAYKVDLKTFDERRYRELGGVLGNVTRTIRDLKDRGVWVEIVTLIVPGFSDDRDDLRRMADFLAETDPHMPWHVTAFHPDYKMTDGFRRTTVDDLLGVVEIARNAGLRFVYAGNLPGRVNGGEETACPRCGATVIRRRGFTVLENRLGAGGRCPDCGGAVPGVWS